MKAEQSKMHSRNKQKDLFLDIRGIVAELCFTGQGMLKDHKIIKKSNLIAIQLTHLFHALFANLKLKYLKIIWSQDLSYDTSQLFCLNTGPFMNYVSIVLPIFDQVSTLSKRVTKVSILLTN